MVAVMWRRLALLLVPIVALLTLFDGGRFSLQEHQGPVVLDFWVSWCVPCREEAALLESACRAHRDRGVVFLGVNILDTDSAAREFIKEFGVTFPNGPDPGSRIAVAYGVYGVPELFVIARDGQITYKHIGAISPAVLNGKIDEGLRGVVATEEGRSDQYQSAR